MAMAAGMMRKDAEAADKCRKFDSFACRGLFRVNAMLWVSADYVVCVFCVKFHVRNRAKGASARW